MACFCGKILFRKCWTDIKNVFILLRSVFVLTRQRKNVPQIFIIKDNVKLILLWGFVSIPIVWGFLQTFQKVLGLFQYGM